MAMNEQAKSRVKEAFNQIIRKEWPKGTMVVSGLFGFNNVEPKDPDILCTFYSEALLSGEKPLIGPWLVEQLNHLFDGCGSVKAELNYSPNGGKPDGVEGTIARLKLGDEDSDVEALTKALTGINKFLKSISNNKAKTINEIQEWNQNNGTDVSMHKENILSHRKSPNTGGQNTPPSPSSGGSDENHSDLNAEIQSLLLSNLNVILTGAPGTGKTYTAKQVAKAFVAENESFERFIKLIPDFDEADTDKRSALKKFFKTLPELDFVENLPEYDQDKWQEKLFTARVQFHPGYDYSDFVIGMKPEIVDGKDGAKNVSFRWKDGIFKAFTDRARTVYDEWCNQKDNDPKEAPRFVFIIDEINRADLSRVFGELFSLLEESYRYSRKKVDDEKSDENSITLPNGGEFVIPENLFIIGTMNDIDRSVESMDFALRRRFAWYEVTADQSEGIIGKKVSDKTAADNLVKAMRKLNAVIGGEEKLTLENGTETDLRLGTAYQLGGAIFAKFEKCNGDFAALWNNHISNVLGEYLRGRRDRDDVLKALMGIFNKAIGIEGGGKTPEANSQSPLS